MKTLLVLAQYKSLYVMEIREATPLKASKYQVLAASRFVWTKKNRRIGKKERALWAGSPGLFSHIARIP